MGDLMKPSQMKIRAPYFSQERGFSNIVQVGSHQEETLEGLKTQKVPLPYLLHEVDRSPYPSGSYPKGKQVMLGTRSSYEKYLRSPSSRS